MEWENQKIFVSGGMINFAGGGELFHGLMGIWGRVLLIFQTFLKAKTAICRYWTLIKIKISATCVCKEYEGKMKTVQEQWLQLKMKLFLVYNIKMVIWWKGGGGLTFGAGNKNLVEGCTGGRWSDFWKGLFRNLQIKWTYQIYLTADRRQQVS